MIRGIRYISLSAVMLALTLMTRAAEEATKEEPHYIKEEPHYIDEVVWVVGDEAILRSDIEMTRLQSEQEGVK